MAETKVIKRMGQTEMRVIEPPPETREVHETPKVGPTGRVYDPHVSASLSGGIKPRAPSSYGGKDCVVWRSAE